MKKIICILSFLMALLPHQFAQGDLQGCGKVKPDSVVYKQTPQGELQLYFHYPDDWQSGDRRPVMVFFFGGGWVAGRTTHFSPQAKYFAQRGLVTVRADYRVRNRHGTLADRCVEDGKSAVRWIRKNAELIGGDPDRIIASGGSAGGHVAICTRVADGFETEGEDLSVSSKPDLLVLYNPVMETKEKRFMPRFSSGEAAFRASPNDHLDESVPPMILFFGSEDELAGYAYRTMELGNRLRLDARLWIADGVGHGFFNRPPWLETTIYLTDRFLIEQGYLGGKPAMSIPENGEMQRYEPR
jgi:acetyl esterase/lipase